MNLKATALRLLRYVRPHKWGLLLGIACFFLSAAVEPALPAMFQKMLDQGFKNQLGFPIWVVPLVIIGLFTARGLLAFAGTYLLYWAVSRIVLALRADLVTAILR